MSRKKVLAGAAVSAIAGAVASAAQNAVEAVVEKVQDGIEGDAGQDASAAALEAASAEPSILEKIVDTVVPDAVQELVADATALAGIAIDTVTGIPDGSPFNKALFLVEKLGEALQVVLTDSDADTHAVFEKFEELKAKLEGHPKAVAA